MNPTSADFPDLLLSLRNINLSPEERANAARQLGELMDLEAVESLIRSAREDPSPLVKAAAENALKELLGNQAAAALEAYQASEPPEEDWLVEIQDAEEPWTDGNLHGLSVILQSEPDPALRIKAIHILKGLTDISVGSMLANVYWRDEEKQVREAARQAVEERFPGSAEDILDSAKPFDDADEDEDEEWDGEDPEEEQAEEPAVVSTYGQPSSPFVEEKTTLLPFLIAGLVLAAAVIIWLALAK